LVRTGITSPKTLVYASTQIGAGSYGAFNGNIPECIIFPNVLSDANRQILECNQISFYSVSVAAPSLTLGQTTRIPLGTTSSSLPFTSPNSITNYSITWNASAISAGFVNVTNASFPFSQISIAVPAVGPVAGSFYSGTLTVTYNCNGASTNYPFRVYITNSNVLNNAGLTAATPSSVAFSMRLLSSTYTGPAVQIRRSSDGELRDVYFDGTGIVSLTSQVSLAGGGAATATTLSSWIGANSGTVAIWYDQSGQWKNASNATAASQPRIINAGVIDLVNGKPSLFTDGVDDSLTFSNSVTNNFSIFILGSTTATQEIDPESNSSTSGTSGQKYILGAIQNGGGLPVNSGQGLSLGTNGISNYELADGYMPPTAVYSGAVTGLNLVDVIYSNRTPSIYQNATLVRTGITSPKTLVYASTQIGAGPPYGAFNGNIPECIIFPNVLSDANRQILECNQSAYYSIALATVTSPSINPTVCIGSAIPNITHTTVGTTGIGATTGLPAGVSAAWASNTITISGTPMASGTFNYSIPLTGGCGVVNATGTITVNGLTNASCGAFITRWNLATAGSGATQLSIGTATSGTVNYYWQQVTGGTATGSGSFSGSTLTITGLPTGATIRLGIYPTNFQRININNGADRSRLLDVEQWGSTVWTSMEQAFRDCNNLNITASDIPVLTSCTSMHQMFQRCATLNGPTNINSWNTSAVTNMVEMFEQATLFNQNIGSWNTAAVTNMAEMFRVAIAFNQNIGSWNTGAVTNMTRMFSEAAAFNQNIGSWNTGAVTNMSSMFQQASSFNQNIGSWNTSAVTTMNSMFQNATVFNQNIGSWTTSAVTTMNSMFTSAITFNNGGSSTINNWNTGVVTDMSFMFFQATAFNQNIGNWNTGAVTNMRQMFYLASAFNQNIGSWNTAAVTNMSDMFLNATAFNQNLGNWTLNATVNLSNMLNNSGMDCSNYSATLVGWNSNPSCPTGRTLGATGRTYGPQATAARANLVGAKGWTITGDTPFAVGAASSTQTLCINTVLTNITHTTSGATGIGVATGLPSGVTASWAANVITIIGTPTASGTFNYSIPLTGGCGAVNATGIITVTPANTAGVASSTPTVNINTALTTITHTTSGATGIGAATGLPTGVTATWASNTITISGTPTVVGIFNYSIPLTGGCGAVNATGTITVTRDTDGDGVGDTADGDDDNDGIIDTLECCIDSDGDGVTDTLDIDDDNDGIPDIEEAGFKAYSNGKSTMDRSSAATWVDANANGINDFIDAMITAGTYLLPDTDGDGVPNYRDLDSDNDALFDIDEANIFNGDGDSNGDCDSNGDGNGDGLDGDGDGLLNLYDNSASYGTTARAYAQDADVNGTPDYMQLDSNSDGVKDIAETLYSALDINNDGKIDGTVDIDNDGLLDAFDTNTAVKGSPRDLNRKLYLDFDGRNDYGQDATALGVLANETIMAWVDLNSAFSAAGVIAGQPGFQLRINSSRNLQAVVNGSTITYSTPVAPFATAVLNTSQWYHVGAVYDGSTVKLYLNGVMVASGAASGNIASAALTLGKNPSAASNYFKGKIDEVRIFDVALTDLQFQRMVYQEVQNTGSQVRGSIVPKDIQSLPYANLLRNYRMDAYKDDIVDDVTTASIDSGTGMKIYNHKIIKAQEAPIPFVTRTTGTFATAIDDSSKDIRGLDVMDFDYSIIQVKHNITETANSTDLAMLVDSGVTVNMTNDTKIQNDWYLKLDGKIDLVGKSQLIQTADSELDATSTGSIERDQQGQSNMFNYNYWSSPVSTINSTTINHGFTVNGVMRDGTNASSPQNLQWTTGINSTATSPITLSSYWIFKFQNSSNTYANWSSVGQNGTLLAGQGFTMKGSSAATANQNYAFIGKPNNGTITSTVGANNLNLCGNPFPSAIDANQFIDDNITSITGTLYIWEHYSSNTSHNTIEYQGGYATYTKTGGTAPVAPSGVSGIGSSSKTPKRFIPVSQGFFVTGSATGGTITFNNGQRLFVKEDDATSYTMFKGTNPTVRADSNPEMNNAQDSYIEEQFMKLRLGFNSTNNYHRQTLLGFMNQYATAGYDNGYDGISIETLTNDMYFINGAKKLNINGDGFFNVNNVYPIGVKNATSGNVTFVVDGKENFSDSQEIYIHDNVTNTYNSIKSQPYQVNLPAGTYDTRFTLRFTNGSSLGTTDNEENHGIAVIHSQSNNMITIKNVLQEVTVKSVSLFNLLGQQVTNWKIDNQNQADIQLKVSDVSAGTYIVKVFTDGGEITKKILVKK
jgi:surface protein